MLRNGSIPALHRGIPPIKGRKQWLKQGFFEPHFSEIEQKRFKIRAMHSAVSPADMPR